MQFTWDERKNRSNKSKHGVPFEAAILVFDDPYHLSRPDRDVGGELRWHTLGTVPGMHVLLVAHTLSEPGEDGEETIRMISARKATPRERSAYAQGI
ncbi:MAG TPA: BrnT family toxin [Terriglobia bacterium]|nr:BrnT family toxin [Terriglobia bacterium]